MLSIVFSSPSSFTSQSRHERQGAQKQRAEAPDPAHQTAHVTIDVGYYGPRTARVAATARVPFCRVLSADDFTGPDCPVKRLLSRGNDARG